MKPFDEELQDLHKDARASKIREGSERERVYISVTTGALALSVALFAILGSENFNSIEFLVASWILLLIAIILKLISYITVQFHFETYERAIESARHAFARMRQIQFVNEKNFWTKFTHFIDYASSLFTVLGLLLLVFFGVNNLKNMSSENNNIPTEKEKFAEPAINTPPPIVEDDTQENGANESEEISE